jgi:hypothetical protein
MKRANAFAFVIAAVSPIFSFSAYATGSCANQLANSFESAYANGSAAQVASLYANNAVLDGDFFPQPLNGPAEIELTESFLFGSFCDVEWVATNKVVDNKKIAFEYELTATFCGPFPGPDGSLIQPTGNRQTLRLATVLRVNNNCKIIDEYRYANVQAFYDFILTP